MTRPDLFFPAISHAGLHPDRVVFCESDREEEVLSLHGGGAVFLRSRLRYRRARPPVEHRFAPPAARGGEDRQHDDRAAALEAAERGVGLWAAEASQSAFSVVAGSFLKGFFRPLVEALARQFGSDGGFTVGSRIDTEHHLA